MSNTKALALRSIIKNSSWAFSRKKTCQLPSFASELEGFCKWCSPQTAEFPTEYRNPLWKTQTHPYRLSQHTLLFLAFFTAVCVCLFCGVPGKVLYHWATTRSPFFTTLKMNNWLENYFLMSPCLSQGPESPLYTHCTEFFGLRLSSLVPKGWSPGFSGIHWSDRPTHSR